MELFQLLGLAVLVLAVLLFLYYYKQRWPVSNFPPGPTGLPIIGTALATGSDFTFNRTAPKLVNSYGNVCSFMLDTPMVLVNGYDSISEAVSAGKGWDFSSRKVPFYSNELYNPKKLGIFSADMSSRWEHQRKFAHTTLRSFGAGKSSFEGKITTEVQTLLEELRNIQDGPQDLSTLLTVGVANVMCDIIVGSHYDHNDKTFQHILHVMHEWLITFGKPKMVLLEYIPLVRPFLKQQAKEMKDIYAEFCTFTMGKVAEHQKTYTPSSEPRDFIDYYLAKNATDPHDFSLEELRYVLSDLFSAATDTTANTLKFGLLYMIVNPDVQEKVHQESMKIVGTSRLPCLEDRDKMPYTVATIHEIQRLSCVATALPRSATVDTTLGGYNIPKGTNILCNIWGLHHDPVAWPDPERFDPNRHLNDEGEVVKNRNLLPFGAGRRVCMGESLAKMELFLFFSSMMHRFKFEIPPGTEAPSLEPLPGFTSAPSPYQVVITEYM